LLRRSIAMLKARMPMQKINIGHADHDSYSVETMLTGIAVLKVNTALLNE